MQNVKNWFLDKIFNFNFVIVKIVTERYPDRNDEEMCLYRICIYNLRLSS